MANKANHGTGEDLWLLALLVVAFLLAMQVPSVLQ